MVTSSSVIVTEVAFVRKCVTTLLEGAHQFFTQLSLFLTLCIYFSYFLNGEVTGDRKQEGTAGCTSEESRTMR
jgi:hypothetical protein